MRRSILDNVSGSTMTWHCFRCGKRIPAGTPIQRLDHDIPLDMGSILFHITYYCSEECRDFIVAFIEKTSNKA